MKPEVQAVLRASGLDQPEGSNNESTIGQKLTRAGLGTDDIAEELTHLAKNSANETLRLRALETAMKAHGVLKEAASVQVPTFNVFITQTDGSLSEGSAKSNMILFPRQSIGSLPQPVQEKESVN